ncbi:putative Trimethyllysine dioxygenase [Podospora fimiseda]|uniref:Trimethyllysine dioxygenase n=1 Tax=Podospora fimiseda TaxID=252190 RepID=A0AAN7BPH8_9PEZI|nr:putative Trimethyllysine dioxygenase [Podospora fimiseda]
MGIAFKVQDDRPRKFLEWIWLRDNCRCASCVNQDTMQRNFNTFDIPADIHATETFLEDAGVRIKWSDGHESFYHWNWLMTYLARDWQFNPTLKGEREMFGASIANDPPQVTYSSVMASDKGGVAELTAKIAKYGFVFVTETPYEDPADTKRLLERIAFIRETHYGGFYDFTPDLAMADTAYTNLALPAHTDTTYFSDPAGLQAFHLLSHTPAPGADSVKGAEGGKSLLVDGFHAAQTLKRENPEAYKILSTKNVRWHASGNEGISIGPYRRFPVIETVEGSLFRIRWNNDDRGVLPLGPAGEVVKWYNAARKWDEILRRKDMECWIQLEPGKVLIFDNWRVLHGRSAFEGVRRICGAYINHDDFISRWKNTNFPKEHVLQSVRG